jgi:hypothetical protein
MKLFTKVKEIRSKAGKLHFERWAIIETKLFAWYLHCIHEQDQDHMHSHPWSFASIILKGQYLEEVRKDAHSSETILNLKKPFKVAFFPRDWFHSIRRIVEGPIWTMVWVWRGSFEGDKWCYIVDADRYYFVIPFEEYRQLKTEAKKAGIEVTQYIATHPKTFWHRREKYTPRFS